MLCAVSLQQIDFTALFIILSDWKCCCVHANMPPIVTAKIDAIAVITAVFVVMGVVIVVTGS